GISRRAPDRRRGADDARAAHALGDRRVPEARGRLSGLLAGRPAGGPRDRAEALGLVVVVADTSPICYLILIGKVDLLEALFKRVCIPYAVQEELAHPAAPALLGPWIAGPPGWLEIRPASPEEAELSRLHPGEREAILLASELRADLVLLDDKRAR